VQRRHRELHLEQARYEARLAQRQYHSVDPDNRLVASELELRWNEKLERVAQLDQNWAQAEQQAQWNLTAEERAASCRRICPRSGARGRRPNQERKQLLRMTIESVQLDGVSTPGRIEIQIRWRSGTITVASVKRAAPGEALLKTPEQAVSQIHEMAGRRKYTEIAEGLNSAGLRTAFGRRFTSQHVAYICRRDGLSRYRKRARRGSQERPKQTDTEKS